MGDENMDDTERTWTAGGHGQHAVHLHKCLEVTHAAQESTEFPVLVHLADAPDEAFMRPGFTYARHLNASFLSDTKD